MSKNILNTSRFGIGKKDNESRSEQEMTGESNYIPININEIDAFELNPRKVENEKYEQIKASIADIGLQQTLTVTKRPGESHYVLFGGGNTRLRCLKELNQESGGSKFATVTCRFVPYENELKNLIGHVIENEERGEMLLIDKGRALFDLRKLYLSELGEDKFRLKKFVEYLAENGIKSYSYSNVATYIYAFEVLYQHIPASLESGLGKPKVIELRKYRNAIQQYFTHKDFPEFPTVKVQSDEDIAIEGRYTNLAYWKDYKKNAAVSLFDMCMTKLDSNEVEFNLIFLRDKFDLELKNAKPDIFIAEFSQEFAYILENGKIAPETNHVTPLPPEVKLNNQQSSEIPPIAGQGESGPIVIAPKEVVVPNHHPMDESSHDSHGQTGAGNSQAHSSTHSDD